jgi:hypothetical protein
MFGFLKNRKAISEARAKIGVELHRQIKEALIQDERTATEKLSTVFIVGYIYWFVSGGFSCQGIDGGAVVDKQLRLVCDGVMPNKLYDIFQRQMAALEIAKGMKDQDALIRGANISPAQIAKLFETGTEVGVFDAMSLSAKPNNLRNYLLGQRLQYQPLQSEA